MLPRIIDPAIALNVLSLLEAVPRLKETEFPSIVVACKRIPPREKLEPESKTPLLAE